jgi:hypothetical protein
MVNNSMKNYRAIWESINGPIPRDDQNRSFEIHHIDGNHDNCDISNLKLVTIDEHYNIHYNQGDWAACALMSYRMKLTFEQTSEMSRRCQLERVANGTHHLLGPDSNRKRINNGTHHFLNGGAALQRNLKRIANGTHNLVGETNPVHAQIAAGTHHFQTNNPSKQKIEEGTHHFLTNHPNKVQVTCPHCNKTGGATNMKRYHFDKCKKILPST